jgi:hypothetical protein
VIQVHQGLLDLLVDLQGHQASQVQQVQEGVLSDHLENLELLAHWDHQEVHKVFKLHNFLLLVFGPHLRVYQPLS